MKTLVILCVLIGYNAAAQGTFDYAKAYVLRSSPHPDSKVFGGKEKNPAPVLYSFGDNKDDSVTLYRAYELHNIIDAIELMETKGWELVTIDEYVTSSMGLICSYAYFRRKR